VVEGFGGGAEDFGGGFGDERRRQGAAGPDDVDFLAGFVGVVELALYAAGEAGLPLGSSGTRLMIMSDWSIILKSRA